MAYPTILVNSGTGSDTAASGAGPGTALTGTSASFSGSVVTLDGSPDLSGVATDSSHVLYLVTSTGRRFFAITAVDNGAKTVTVADAPAGTASGLTWAIGGKRATIDSASSALLFSADTKPGWTIDIEDSSISLSAAIAPNTAGDTTNGWITLKGPSGLCTITQTANAAAIACGSSAARWKFMNLAIQNSNGTKTSAHGITFNSSQYFVIDNCNIGDPTNTLNIGVQRAGAAPKVRFYDTAIHHCSAQGYTNVSSGPEFRAYGCFFVDNGGRGVELSTTGEIKTVISNVFARNGSDGLYGQIGQDCTVQNNTFDQNTGDGMEVAGFVTGGNGYTICNNNFTRNGGYGLNGPSGFELNKGCVDFNNFGTGATANTSGARNNINAGDNDLAVDPQYTDAASNDFSVGTNVKAKGFPRAGASVMAASFSSTISYVDIGAAQREEAGGTSRSYVIGS